MLKKFSLILNTIITREWLLMKGIYAFPILSLLIVILLSACSSKVADPIILPMTEDVTSITVVSGDTTATSIDEEWMGEVMSILMDMTATSTESVNDSPDVDDYITFHLNCSDDTIKTIFFYEEHGKVYVEQPYQGIYEPAPALSTKITELLKSLDKSSSNLSI